MFSPSVCSLCRIYPRSLRQSASFLQFQCKRQMSDRSQGCTEAGADIKASSLLTFFFPLRPTASASALLVEKNRFCLARFVHPYSRLPSPFSGPWMRSHAVSSVSHLPIRYPAARPCHTSVAGVTHVAVINVARIWPRGHPPNGWRCPLLNCGDSPQLPACMIAPVAVSVQAIVTSIKSRNLKEPQPAETAQLFSGWALGFARDFPW